MNKKKEMWQEMAMSGPDQISWALLELDMWSMPKHLAPRRLMQEDCHDFEASLGFRVRPGLKRLNEKNKVPQTIIKKTSENLIYSV